MKKHNPVKRPSVEFGGSIIPFDSADSKQRILQFCGVSSNASVGRSSSVCWAMSVILHLLVLMTAVSENNVSAASCFCVFASSCVFVHVLYFVVFTNFSLCLVFLTDRISPVFALVHCFRCFP